MSSVPIPAWNVLGLLPPVDPERPTGIERSPYPVRLMDVVMRFATSPARRTILSGFLRYRAELHRLGLTRGFQWLDGSFAEHIEMIEGREPGDIDVVTFLEAPAEVEWREGDEQLFDCAAARFRYRVDGYVVELDKLTTREIAHWSAYWYSVWSHRRNHVWKGCLQVELAADQDRDASAWLSRSTEPSGGQL